MRTGTRTWRIVGLTALVATLPFSTSHAADENLVPNPGFESSSVPKEARAFNQPVIPDGWAVEGITALFDHTPQNPHTGQYAAAISGSYSGPRRDCSVQCTELPGSDQRDVAYGFYSLAPSWRVALPMPVTGGTQYRFGTWIRLSIPKDGTGAITHVRWFDATGAPLGRSDGPKLLAPTGGASYATFAAGTYKDFTTDWTYRSVILTAPAAARSAVIVLSYIDDAWIGQTVYDDVCFAKKSANICD